MLLSQSAAAELAKGSLGSVSSRDINLRKNEFFRIYFVGFTSLLMKISLQLEKSRSSSLQTLDL